MIEKSFRSSLLISILMLILSSCGDKNFRAEGDDRIYGKSMPSVGVLYEKILSDSAGQRKPVVVFSHWDDPEDISDAVYVFFDGESRGPTSHQKFLNRMLYIGPRTDTGAAKTLYMPFLSMSFAERVNSPLELTKPGAYEDNRKYFAAYIAANCVSEREKAFDKLFEFAKANNLGAVHALGKCHGSHPESEFKYPNSDRGTLSYLDTAVEMLKNYKYSLAFENTDVDGYVTEKIASPFLAGTIPIYSGNKKVLDLIDGDTFLYLGDQDISKILNQQSFDEAKRKSMVEKKKIKDAAVYYFSWHPDISPLLRNAQQKTISDDIVDIIKSM